MKLLLSFAFFASAAFAAEWGDIVAMTKPQNKAMKQLLGNRELKKTISLKRSEENTPKLLAFFQSHVPATGISPQRLAGLFAYTREKTVLQDRKFFLRNEDELGYCYKRATVAHYIAFRENNGAPILKIWIWGFDRKLRPGWGYHVSTMVPVAGLGWRVVDPIFRAPLTPAEWVEKCKVSLHALPNATLSISAATNLYTNGRTYQQHSLKSWEETYFQGVLATIQ